MDRDLTWWKGVKGAFKLAWQILPAFFLLTAGVGWAFGEPQLDYPIIRVVLGGAAPLMAMAVMYGMSILFPAVYGKGEMIGALVWTLPTVYLGWVFVIEVMVVGDPFGPFTQLSRYPGQAWADVWPWLSAWALCLGWAGFVRLWHARAGK